MEIVARFDHLHWSEWDSINSDGESFDRVIDQGIGSVVAGEFGGTSRWSHGLGYLFSALRRDGLIPDKLSLHLSALLRSLNLFLKLRVWTVPHSLTTNQPRHNGKQDTIPSFRVFIPAGIHGKRRAKS